MKKTISILIAILMLATCLAGCGAKVNWASLNLNKQLPKPDSLSGDVLDDTDYALCVELNIDTKDEFEQYLSSCQDAGFTIDSKRQHNAYVANDDLYFAYNEEGYRLDLYYSIENGANNKLLRIDLKAPMEITDLDWPFNDLSKMLPQPKSTKGCIESEGNDSFSVYIGDTSTEDFDKYANKCSKAGFSVNSSKNDTIFYAENKDGYVLNIYYVGFNTILIEFYSPDYFSSSDDADID